MKVPLEVTLQIFQRLPKKDLKSIPLCCKAYSVFASEFLFDVVYLSTHEADFWVLADLASHPLLSKCVKQLRWDGSYFPHHITKQAYLSRLFVQLWHIFSKAQSPPYDSPDPKVNELMDLGICASIRFTPPQLRREELFSKFGDCAFVTDGYQKFQEHAHRQDSTFGSDDYWQAVDVFLSFLPNLRDARIDSEWYELSELKSSTLQITTYGEIAPTGSPLARSWNMLHLRPFKWLNPGKRKNSLKHDGSYAFLNMCMFLEHFPQGVRQLVTKGKGYGDDPALPTSLFSSRIGFDTVFSQEFLVIYERMEVLHLSIESDQSPYQGPSPLTDLQAMLQAMPQLKDLRLVLPVNGREKGVALYKFEHIFPPRPHPWQNMNRLEIWHLAVRPASLLSLLMLDAPNLRYLTFWDIELWDGTWEQVLACMSLYLHLSYFHIHHRRGLYYPGMRIVWSEDQPVIRVKDMPYWLDTEADAPHTYLIDSIEEYVKYGGEHPMMKNATPSQLNALQEDVRRIERLARGYNSQRSVPAI
ncbi:MAG: hypothetical protein Q9212_006003 [Teloschistes hypoglaucus]